MKKWILISVSLLVLIGLLGGCTPIKAQPLGLNEPPELALFSPEEEALKQEAINELEEAKSLPGGTVFFAEIQTIIDELNKLIVLQEDGLAEEALALKHIIWLELVELASAADAQGFFYLAAALRTVHEKIDKLIEMETETPTPTPTPVPVTPPEPETPVPEPETPVPEPETPEPVPSPEEELPPPPVTEKELYIYSVKFLLGEAKSEEEGVKPANYLTAVNIHNFLDESFAVKKKAVIAVPQGQPGIVSAYEEFKMRPNWAVEVDGADISDLLGLSFPPESFVKGFVAIESPKPLNVVAVYTSSTSGVFGAGFSMDIEYISPALLPSAPATTTTTTPTPTPEPCEVILYEHYNPNPNDWGGLGQTSWLAQTFTATSNHSVTSVKLLLSRDLGSTPGQVTVSIRNAPTGYPVGPDLTVGTTDGNTLPTGTALGGEWREIPLSSYNLINGTKYAIVVRALDATYASPLLWHTVNPGTYGDGNFIMSPNSGWAWQASPDFDFLFEVWECK